MSRKDTRKVQNIRRKNTVYFRIDTEATPNKGVKGKGTARILKESAKAVPIVEKIVKKYLRDLQGRVRGGVGRRS